MFRSALLDVVVALVVLELTAMGALVVSPWLWSLAVFAVGWPVWSEHRRERRAKLRAQRRQEQAPPRRPSPAPRVGQSRRGP